MLVDVPSTVHMPPNMEAKERGISSFEGLVSARRATTITTGIRIATAAVLFRNDDNTPTPTISTNSISPELCRASLPSALPTKFTAPLRNIPALSTNIAPTVTVAVLANPASPSAGVSTRKTSSTIMTRIATMSVENFSVTNRTTAQTVRPSTNAISHVISASSLAHRLAFGRERSDRRQYRIRPKHGQATRSD